MQIRKPYLVAKSRDMLEKTSIPPPVLTAMPKEVADFLGEVADNAPLQQELVSLLRKSPPFSDGYMQYQASIALQTMRRNEIDPWVKFIAVPQDRRISLSNLQHAAHRLGNMLTSPEALRYLRQHALRENLTCTLSDFVEYLIRGL